MRIRYSWMLTGLLYTTPTVRHFSSHITIELTHVRTDQSSQEIDRRKAELSDLILAVLRRYPYLHYFQGYHDICQVFLLVLEPQTRAVAVARLSVLRIRDYMLPTLAPSLAQCMDILCHSHVILRELALIKSMELKKIC